jgi:hypothetical protein
MLSTVAANAAANRPDEAGVHQLWQPAQRGRSVRFRALLAMHKWLVDMPSGGTVALAGS